MNVNPNLQVHPGTHFFMFQELDEDREAQFRLWSREHYLPGTDIDPAWHPVSQDECYKMCTEVGVSAPIQPTRILSAEAAAIESVRKIYGAPVVDVEGPAPEVIVSKPDVSRYTPPRRNVR